MAEIIRRDPRFVVTTEATDKATGQVVTAGYELQPSDIRGNIMDEIKQLVGDGLARVTVSADFGIKDFGTGASAMASVSLTCGQDTSTIERAARIAGDLARDIAQEQRQRAEQELEAIMAQRGGPTTGTPRF